jgi:glutaredoxin
MSDAKSKADGLIRDNAVMIFSKTTCPYCANSQKILMAKQKEYEAKGTPFSLGVYELNVECEYLDSCLHGMKYITLILRLLQLMAVRFKIILGRLQKQERSQEFSLPKLS